MKGMDEDNAAEMEAQPPLRPKKAVIKRRWAIMRGAGGGVAVIAVAGAIALSDPTDQSDYGDEPGGAGPQVTAES
jgi:hypothetical protein